MTRKRLRVVGPRDSRSEFAPEPEEGQQPESDGFSLHFSGGRGILRLQGERVSQAASVDLLELAIPSISFPFDVTAGVRGLRSRRLSLARMVVSLGLDELEKLLGARARPGSWIGESKLAFEREFVSVLSSYGPEGGRVPFSFRLLPSTGERVPSLLIDDARAYGPLPAPLLVAVLACIGELRGAEIDGLELRPPDPVKSALIEILPRRGWRLPDHGSVILHRLELVADRAELDYRDAELARSTQDESRREIGIARLRKLEEARLTRPGDDRLARGEPQDARKAYARLLEQEPDNAIVAERLAMIDAVSPDLRESARALAMEAFERDESQNGLLAVLAQIGALSGDAAGEVRFLEQLFERGCALERLAAGLRIGRLLSESDPAAAADWLDRALAARRDDPDALLELVRTRAALGESETVERLIQRWIAIHKSPGTRGEAHGRAGRIMLEELGDAERAVRHFERATLANPDDLSFAWGLADALARSGEAERAISGYERLERRCEERGDTAGAARACASIADAWARGGEPRLAVPRYRKAIEIGPRVPERLRRLAGALEACGRHAEAANVLEQSLRGGESVEDGFHRGMAALELARIYLEELEAPAAAEPWLAEASRHEESAEGAQRTHLGLLERQGRWAELTEELERVLAEEPTADTVLALARARIEAGAFSAALSTLEAARERFPRRLEIVDELIRASRGAGEKARLRGLLLERLDSVDDPETRSEMAAEIGTLELDDFQNPGAAVGWLRGALESRPELVEARRALVDALRRLGRSEELEGELDSLARSLRKAGRGEEAALALAERSRLLAAAGHTNRAASLLREALPDLPPDSRRGALLEMAELFTEADNPDAARDLFAAARRERGVETEGEHLAALGEAEAALKTGDHERALEAATAAGSGPASLRARSALIAAKALLFLGRAEQAAGTLERVAENVDEEKAKELLLMAARVRRSEVRDTAAAREILEEIVQIDPAYPGARDELVDIVESTGDRAQLADLLVRTAGDGEDAIADLKRAADFFSAEGQHGSAAEALRRAQSIAPEKETAQMLAAALKRSGRRDEAIEVLGELAKGDAEARAELAAELELAGRHDELARLLESRAEPDPRAEIERLLELARIHRELRGDVESALAMLRRAREVGGDDPRVAAALADQLREASRWGELADHLQGMLERERDAGERNRIVMSLAELLSGPLAAPREAVDALLAEIEGEAPSRRALEIASRALEIASQLGDLAVRVRCLEARAAVSEPREAAAFLVRAADLAAAASAADHSSELLRRALEADASNGEVLARVAADAVERQAWEEAAQLVKRIPESRRSVDLEKLRAGALERAGRSLEAISSWRRIVGLEPDRVEHLDELARLLEAEGDRRQLVAVLGRRLELTGSDEERAELLARRAAARSEATGDPAEGLEDLVAAARLRPQDRELVRAAADASAAGGRWPLAEEMLTLAMEGTGGEERAGLLRRRAAIRRTRLGEPGGAAEDLLAAHRAEGLSPPEMEVLAELLERRGDVKEAARIAGEIARSGDADGVHQARAARLAAQDGDIERAREFWRRGVELNPDPNWIAALVGLLDPASDGKELGGLLDRLAGVEKVLDVEDHWAVLEARVELDLARGREMEAVQGLDAMLDLRPADSGPWARMQSILERRGDWESLAERLRTRLESGIPAAETARLAVALGNLLEDKLGDENGAEECYRRATRAVPDEPRANRALAGLYVGRQQWRELDGRLQRLPEESDDQDLRLWRARAAEHLGRISEARDRYLELVSGDPIPVPAAEGLARVATDPESDRDLAALTDRLLARVGDRSIKPVVYRRLGLAQMRLGDGDAARELLELADRVAGGDPQALELLAQVYERQGDSRSQAEVLARLAYMIGDRPSAAHLAVVGRLHLDALSDPGRAHHWFSQAADEDPDNPEVLLGLADSAWLLGDLHAVARSLERVRLVAPGYDLTARRLYRLAAALAETRAWPDADIVELLDQAMPALEGGERDQARRLAETLRRRKSGR
ncbi:MAG: tetratricopeptide repeat protein [Polyangia bacterium]